MRMTFIILLTMPWLMLFGQFHPLENYPTPNVSSLGEFGKVPVNMFSGVPSISIPLYELKEGNLSLPISLNYNLASVKPNIHPGWVGLGWSLSAGGYISRNVRGAYDEKTTTSQEIGFYYHCNELQQVSNSANLGSYKNHYMGDNGATTFELMTDEYSFSFGPYSGHFYLNEHGEWVVVSDDEIKVEFDAATGFRSINQLRAEINTQKWKNKEANQRFFDKFTLVTPDGVRYTFGGQYATEYSIDYYNRNNKDLVPTTWYLSEILSPEGYSIQLEYETGSPICEIKFAAYSSYTYQDFEDAGGLFSGSFLASGDRTVYVDNTKGYKKLSGFLLFPVYLKKITSTFVEVEFHSSDLLTEGGSLIYEDFLAWGQDAFNSGQTTPFTSANYNPSTQFEVFMPNCRDICELPQQLKWRTLKGISINHLTNTKNDKTFYLGYENNSRKKLTIISEQIGTYRPDSTYRNGGWYDCVTGGEYLGKFLVLNVPIPTEYSPLEYQFSYNETETFPRYVFASTDHWGYYNGYDDPNTQQKGERAFSTTYTFNENFYNTRNATYNLDIAQAETLKEIIYPTGGKTCFTYQPNRYTKVVPPNRNDGLLNESGSGGGLCVSAISHYDETGELVQTKKYYYTDEIPAAGAAYTASGILNAKKEYVMYYNLPNGGIHAIASEGGFNVSNTNDPVIGYSSVIEETTDAQGHSTGYVRYRYTNFDQDIWGETHTDQNYSYAYNISGYAYASPISSRSQERGKILSEEYFDADKRLTKKVQYKYDKVDEDTIKMPWQEAIFTNHSLGEYAYFSFMNYVYTHRYLLSEKIETECALSNQAALTKKQTYVYNKQKQVVCTETILSDKDVYKTEYKYPMDFSTTYPYNMMVQRNILSPIIRQTDKKDNNLVHEKLTEYTFWNGRTFAPQYVKQRTNTQDELETRMTFLEYDFQGNPAVFSKDDAASTTILWGYDMHFPIIEIKNKTRQEIENQLSGDGLDLYYQWQFSEPMSDEDIRNLGKCLQAALPDAQVTTYTYEPAVGMTSMTDPQGITTYYDYDAFGRLKESYIMEGGVKKTLETYDYHYSNQ